MEFPFHFIKVISLIYKGCCINKYPSEINIKDLEEKVSIFLNLPKDTSVTLFNGSDEALSSIIASAPASSTIGFLNPSFSMYKYYCKSYNKKFTEVSLNKTNFKVSNYKINTISNCDIFILCYPNNPTGNLLGINKVLYLITKCKNTKFLIDEAYYFYSNKTLINLTRHKNITVLRTLSKIGFAGIRIGALIFNSKKKSILKYAKSPYNLGTYQIKLLFLILTKNLMKLINIGINRINKYKKITYSLLSRTLYIKSFESYGNFILFENSNTCERLLFSNSIKLRKFYFNYKSYYRVSIGGKRKLFSFYKEILKNDRRLRLRKKN
ncbi:aminotransferase class I/II-fold pyridoxal phosphate-dependent enzyme [Candidatus Vidania fulgoroideorum]